MFLFLGALPAGVEAQTFYHTGSDEAVETGHLPGLVLAGGNTDNDDAMRWMLERADGGDVVVLRAAGSDGYNNYFYQGLGVDVNSVVSIVISSSEEADKPEVIEALENAEVVFIAGGNQWNYVNHWQGTEMLATLNRLIKEKGITIGGTSAGMAVLGEVVFSAENNTVWSSEAIENPYHWRVTLEKDFISAPFMENTVTDSHYNRIQGDERNRHGRHVAFMARMATDWDMPARGIAANDYTAIAVDEEGIARVFGDPDYPDYAYFLRQDAGPPEVCEEGSPLTWNQEQRAIRVYEIKGDHEGSNWFDIDSWEEGEGGHWEHWYVISGSLMKRDLDVTGTESLNLNKDKLNLYPNPAGDILNIRWGYAQGDINIRLLTSQGVVFKTRKVQKHEAAGGHELELDVSWLQPGLYLVEVSDDRSSVTTPWVKL